MKENKLSFNEIKDLMESEILRGIYLSIRRNIGKIFALYGIGVGRSDWEANKLLMRLENKKKKHLERFIKMIMKDIQDSVNEINSYGEKSGN